ncbi:hypothetical protein M0802_008079 [Mischocyttarus mexicanus]|nr:hypothetical protein M0802_008079 [Mischocyttarus mexicanus]
MNMGIAWKRVSSELASQAGDHLRCLDSSLLVNKVQEEKDQGNGGEEGEEEGGNVLLRRVCRGKRTDIPIDSNAVHRSH